MKTTSRKQQELSPPESPENNQRPDMSGSSSSEENNAASVPGRPDLSYAHLAALAIDASGKKRCTVGEIYSWIETNFPYYKNGCPWWKNCIRHNLSMKRSFVRIKCEGINMWAINPAHYDELLKSKRRRNLLPTSASSPSSSVPVLSNVPPSTAPALGTCAVSVTTPTSNFAHLSTAPTSSHFAYAPANPVPMAVLPTVMLSSHTDSRKRPASPKTPRIVRRPRKSSQVEVVPKMEEPTLTSFRAPVEEIWLLGDHRSPSPCLLPLLSSRAGATSATLSTGFASICGAATQRTLFSSTPELMGTHLDRLPPDNWFSIDFAQPC
eukprot:m.40517 g.40517  ORF g.40517 m.40517 type:complete len:323 (+) comp5616_c0_seq1:205-1173(+)